MPIKDLPVISAGKKIVVVVPAYNEGPVLLQVIDSLSDAGMTVIVVDDGSDEPVKNLIGKRPVVLISHQVNLGQGAAIQTGLSYAKRYDPDIVITFDADDQHDINDIPAMITPVLNGSADIVLGSRFLHQSTLHIPPVRKILLYTARFIESLFSGIKLTDAHNGFRVFGRAAIEKIEITENRMAHASEIIFLVSKYKLRWKEVGVHVRYTDYSKKKGQTKRDSIKVLFDLVLHKFFK